MKIKVVVGVLVVLSLAADQLEARVVRVRRQDIHFKTYDDDHKIFEDRMKPPPARGFSQTSAANTGSQTLVNQLGETLQQTAGGSQSSNLANDGSSGQLSAANTQQQTFQSGNTFQNQNTGQSQSANFGKEHQILSNANTNTNTVKENGNVRQQSEGGAGTSVVDKLGSQSSQAQTKSETIEEADKKGSKSSGSSQSLQLGKDGTASGANSNSGAETIELADGSKITKSFSSSSSFQSSGNVKAGASATGFSSTVG